MFLGFDRATGDTLGVAALDVASGTTTQWMSAFGETGSLQLLDGGPVFVSISKTEDSLELYRVTGPGAAQRLGSPARPLLGVSVSADFKRATAVERDYHADAWMYNVVRY